MSKIAWDNPEDRIYEAGVDRGVLYLPDYRAVPWNGLTSIDVKSVGGDTKPLYFDGVKIYDVTTIGDFAATIKAVTYPDEFSEMDGIVEWDEGISFDNQPRKTFCLSYRTLIGDANEGLKLGYKIHIVYNLTAEIDTTSYKTFDSNVAVTDLSWNVTSVPEHVPGFRPTARVIIDSRKITPANLAIVETMLYGTEYEDARIPTITDIMS